MKNTVFTALLASTLFSCSSTSNSNTGNDELIIGKWKLIEWGTIVNTIETPSEAAQINPNKLSYYIFNNDKSFVSEIHLIDYSPVTQQYTEGASRTNGNYTITGDNIILLGITTPLYGGTSNNPSNYNEDVRIITLDNSNLKIYSNENNNYYFKLIKV